MTDRQSESYKPEREQAQVGGTPVVNHPSPERAGDTGIRVVGIGASAGGLEALKDLLGSVPDESGMAFVVVQHLEPSHESRMAEILAKYTGMKVVQAEDGFAVERDTVYTTPPGRALSIREGRLVLGQSTGRAHVEAAIDHFLISLAEDQGSKAICIILSGSSGSDGPRGVRAVRAAGGMCMAQEPGSAQFAAMPQMAIDTGLVDYILAPGEMGAPLVEFARHGQGFEKGGGGAEKAGEVEGILNLLRARTDSDYSHYKRATVIRRIQRRMGLRQIGEMEEYGILLRKDENELTQLAKDMLIGVSSFFRDARAFESLGVDVIEPLVRAKEGDAPLRVWVAGCATGEEAYSIAMLLLEARSAAGKFCPVQVFATDVDEQALEIARAGVYPPGIAADVSRDRLKAFFVRQGQNYQVVKHLREAVVFSRHNLLVDPPFSKLDLISCRNVLIYIESPAQKKVLSVFSFALNVGGHLFLGRSEGVAGMEDLFEPVSKHNRIYRLTRSNRRAAGAFPLHAAGRQAGPSDREQEVSHACVLQQVNLEGVLEHFGASVVLVDAEGEILYFSGQTDRYLGHPKGSASLNILDMSGGILSAELRRAMEQALGQDQAVSLEHVPLPRDRVAFANVTVMRVPDRAGRGKLLAIIFEEAQPRPRSEATESVTAEDEPLVGQLEAEVRALRGELRTNAEGYDLATEELKAANEEVMSMNEELQSANEELDASREELQSLNEELTVVNSQLNDKLDELTEANNDLSNLLVATNIATIFLDGSLRIRRFTPRATDLLNLIESDVGRPIGHITQNFSGVDLASDAAAVLKSLSPVEKEVQVRDGRWYTLRVLPYRTLDDRIDGTVVTFSEVSRLKRAEGRLRSEKTYAEQVIATVRHPLLVLDGELRILSANRAFYETFQVDPGETVERQLFELGNGQWDIAKLRQLLEETVPKESAFRDFRVEHVFEQIGRKVMLVSGRKIEPTDDMPGRLLLTVEDITDREKAREGLGALNAELEQRVTDRTALAEQRSDQLRRLASALSHIEQRERKRLAQVLHDDLQQLLVAAKFQLATLRSNSTDETLQAAVAFMDDLLKQALDASRSLTVELSPTILYESGLDAALPWLARQMEARHHLKVDVVINTVVAQDDEGVAVLLFSAVRELLLNIVKHANVDTAHVQLDRIDDEVVQIVVSDQGEGFDPAGVRAAEDTATGLGLFSLRERLEHVGGECVIDSVPGRGTSVTLRAKVALPEQSAADAEAATRPQEAPAGSLSTLDRADGKIRVLLVDDHAIVRQGLSGLLNAEPDIAVIAEAGCGREAIEQARIHGPDVIIMDICMPGMNGIEATRVIRSEIPDAKIIGLSMHHEADSADAMREAGAVGYVSKGGPCEELLAAIREADGAGGQQRRSGSRGV